MINEIILKDSKPMTFNRFRRFTPQYVTVIFQNLGTKRGSCKSPAWNQNGTEPLKIRTEQAKTREQSFRNSERKGLLA